MLYLDLGDSYISVYVYENSLISIIYLNLVDIPYIGYAYQKSKKKKERILAKGPISVDKIAPFFVLFCCKEKLPHQNQIVGMFGEC